MDFERVTSLDGTFIANKFNPSLMTKMGQGGGHRYHNNHGVIDDWAESEIEWDESDIIAEEARHSSHSWPGRPDSYRIEKFMF